MKPPILGIDHVVLRVADMKAMARFYCEVIGCHIEKEQPDLGLVQLRAGHSLIDLLIENAPIDRADGYGQSIYLFDPEGNMVELKGPPRAAAG
ncbi:VOC family protein [Burkholderia gladioli]|uniref:VOC family protein n=1 Tax=Burkholderia gladioli TaxID=28095 RepID=UPI00163EECF4|nr:VOC family protein [Burkholderia gladioli]